MYRRVFKDLRIETKPIEFPIGEPENPLTDEEIQRKFRKLAAITLRENQVDEIARTVHRLEMISDIMALTELLQA